MSPVVRAALIWMPRLTGAGMALFLGLFALDVFTDPAPGVMNAAMHLAPAALVGVVVAAAWRAPWIGAVLFTIMATAYAASALDRPDWILAISGPLAATAWLYLLSALSTRRRRPAPSTEH